jgi:hypothetical protein
VTRVGASEWGQRTSFNRCRESGDSVLVEAERDRNVFFSFSEFQEQMFNL